MKRKSRKEEGEEEEERSDTRERECRRGCLRLRKSLRDPKGDEQRAAKVGWVYRRPPLSLYLASFTIYSRFFLFSYTLGLKVDCRPDKVSMCYIIPWLYTSDYTHTIALLQCTVYIEHYYIYIYIPLLSGIMVDGGQRVAIATANVHYYVPIYVLEIHTHTRKKYNTCTKKNN